jgi:hypothetical protein
MIDTIVTHVPFHRLGDIQDYFSKNSQEAGAKRSIAYVDDVFSEKQEEMIKQQLGPWVEIRSGKWRDKNLTIIQILKDLKSERVDSLFIDSDNLLDPGFQELDNKIDQDFYTIFEHGRKSMDTVDPKRVKHLKSITVDERNVDVSSYRIVGGIWTGIFYLGPKQGIRLGERTLSALDSSLIDKLEMAIRSLPYGIGNQLSDEATLGILFYYSGIRETPWIEFSTHLQADLSGRGRYSRVLKSLANSKLARGVFSKSRPRVYWYYFRYKLTEILYSIID